MLADLFLCHQVARCTPKIALSIAKSIMHNNKAEIAHAWHEGTLLSPPHIMCLVNATFTTAVLNNFLFLFSSRMQHTRFRSLAPNSDKQPTSSPTRIGNWRTSDSLIKARITCCKGYIHTAIPVKGHINSNPCSKGP